MSEIIAQFPRRAGRTRYQWSDWTQPNTIWKATRYYDFTCSPATLRRQLYRRAAMCSPPLSVRTEINGDSICWEMIPRSESRT